VNEGEAAGTDGQVRLCLWLEKWPIRPVSTNETKKGSAVAAKLICTPYTKSRRHRSHVCNYSVDEMAKFRSLILTDEHAGGGFESL